MHQKTPAVASPANELKLTRVIEAARERVFAVWTTQLPRWWGPHGMTTPVCEMHLETGGSFRTVMRAPDGREFATRGIFLEVTAPERIVFTDAFDPEWAPHPDIFFTGIVTFETLPGGRTRYTAQALHWTSAAKDKHEQMGFHQGWGESTDRLVAAVING